MRKPSAIFFLAVVQVTPSSYRDQQSFNPKMLRAMHSNSLGRVSLRTKLHPIKRAASFKYLRKIVLRVDSGCKQIREGKKNGSTVWMKESENVPGSDA